MWHLKASRVQCSDAAHYNQPQEPSQQRNINRLKASVSAVFVVQWHFLLWQTHIDIAKFALLYIFAFSF